MIDKKGIPALYRVVESTTHFTCLGIRFWDPVAGKPVDNDLSVTARPQNGAGTVRAAMVTRSGVYAFSRLPGLREIEQGAFEEYPMTSPPVQKRFIVEVRDPGRRFVDVGFTVDLPLDYPGLYLSRHPHSPPGSIPRGVNLYSAVTRTPPAMVVAVRGELFDRENEQPAAHAVVCAHTEDGFQWYGLADAQGRFVAFLPYPTLIGGIGGSPAAQSRTPLHRQTWPLSVSVCYAPHLVRPLPASTINEYSTVLNQPPARIWPVLPESGGTARNTLDIQLGYGQDVILKTAGHSKLMVSPAASPPS